MIGAALIYISFLAFVGFLVVHFNSAAPLWLLILMPTFKSGSRKEESDK